MSELLPPIRDPLVDEGRLVTRPFYRWMEGVDRAVGTPPQEGATGTAGNYDVGGQGERVPLLSGFGTDPNIWTGYNVFTKYVVTQAHYRVLNLQVVGARKTGWATSTGTATRTAFDTATVTLPQLAERVKALIDDLHATAGHGLIGA